MNLAKRGLDIAVSLLLLALFSPILSATALLIRVFLGSPVLFKQTRPGFCGKPFSLWKFRTMTDACDAHSCLLPDAQRLTSLGAAMRSFSLDELPELFNVLMGNMSLVGPRPLLMEYLDRYTPEQMRRHNVKPGITGWAQVNGRNNLPWTERFELDVWYVDHWSFLLDLKILCLTFLKVIRREGISAEGHATMPAFVGSGKREEVV